MQSYLEEALRWKETKQETFAQINRANIPLVLFGKTPAVDRAFLDEITVPVDYIWDNNPEKWGTSLWGLRTVKPGTLEYQVKTYNVLILVPFEAQIIPQLKQLAIPPREVFRLDLYFEEPESGDYFESKRHEIEWICERLGDSVSKDTYLAAIRYRINRDSSYLRDVSLPRRQQYFPAELGGYPFFNHEEVFADAGAFIGDTIEAFLAAVEGQYTAIYGFEPDHTNFQKLLRSTSALDRVVCTNVAVGENKGELSFLSDDSSSKSDEHGETVVEVNSLDVLLQGIPVSYLKMDVEGMECEALRGAKEIIRTYHPKLAICTYHSNADMIEVPKLILEIDPTYKLYFRHYTNALVETVCYAL